MSILCVIWWYSGGFFYILFALLPGLRLWVLTVPGLFFCFWYPEILVCCLFLPFRQRLRLWVSIPFHSCFSVSHIRNPWFQCLCGSAAIGVWWPDARRFSCFWALLVQHYCLIGCGSVGAAFPSVLVAPLWPFHPACFPHVTHPASIGTVTAPTASCISPLGHCCQWNFGCAFPSLQYSALAPPQATNTIQRKQTKSLNHTHTFGDNIDLDTIRF